MLISKATYKRGRNRDKGPASRKDGSENQEKGSLFSKTL